MILYESYELHLLVSVANGFSTKLRMSWWVLCYKQPVHVNIIWVRWFAFSLCSAQNLMGMLRSKVLIHNRYDRHCQKHCPSFKIGMNLKNVNNKLFKSFSLCLPVTGSVLPKHDINSPSGSSFFMLFNNTFKSSDKRCYDFELSWSFL